MEYPVQPRTGIGDDIVYWRRRFLCRLFPNSWNIGWYPYANVASARNQQIKKLNKASRAAVKALEEWARLEAIVQEDSTFIKTHSFNDLGVGDVELMSAKELSKMLPLCGRVETEFKTVIHKHLIDKALLDAGVKPEKSKKADKADMIVTTVDGSKQLNGDHARHVMAWKSKEDANKKGSKQGGNKGNNKQGGQGKSKLNQLKQVFKKDADESNDDWNERLQAIIDEEG
jgi:hypothetical protein